MVVISGSKLSAIAINPTSSNLKTMNNIMIMSEKQVVKINWKLGEMIIWINLANKLMKFYIY